MEPTTNQDQISTSTSSEASSPLTEDQLKLIAQGGAALQQALQQDPSLEAEIERVISEFFGKGITSTTLQSIEQALGLYIENPKGVEYLLTVLINSDVEDYVPAVQKQTEPGVWKLLRRLLALYGKDAREANNFINTIKDGWKDLNRKVYYDIMSERWVITLNIVKQNGEQITLDETPSTVMVLATGILDTLNHVPADIAPSIVDSTTLAGLKEQYENLIKLYSIQPQTETPTAVADTDATVKEMLG